MARLKTEWISGKQAAVIMSKNSGHTITPDYVRRLARTHKIRQRPIDGRTNEYHRGDVESYVVSRRSKSEEEHEAIPA